MQLGKTTSLLDMIEAILLSYPTVLQQYTLVCLRERGFLLSSSMVAIEEEDPYNLEKLSGHMTGRSLHHHIFSFYILIEEEKYCNMDQRFYLILDCFSANVCRSKCCFLSKEGTLDDDIIWVMVKKTGVHIFTIYRGKTFHGLSMWMKWIE